MIQKYIKNKDKPLQDLSLSDDFKQRLPRMMAISTGILCMHAFHVIGMQVIYARFNTLPADKLLYKNSIIAFHTIRKQKGPLGFFAGFAPALCTYAFTYNEDFRKHFFNYF